MFFILTFLVFVISVKYISNGIIIPDSQNPITMKYPNKDMIGNLLTFRFALPPDSIGLVTSQYIGVKFPENMKSVLNLKQSLNTPFNQFSCNLTDVSGKNYSVSSSPTNDNETTFFCRYDETQVNLVAGGRYILNINLTALSFNIIPYVRMVGLFTSTSNSFYKIIIDNNPVFGDIVTFPDWNNVLKPEFNITDINLPGGTVNMDSTFDVILTIKLFNFFSSSNVFMLKLPADTVVKGPITITSQRGDVNGNAGEIASPLVGNMVLTPFGIPQTYIINGITDTKMIPGRYFRLTFTQITVNDFIPIPVQNNPAAADRYLEIWVYYPNSYTVISFSKALLCSFKTAAISKFIISHPNNKANIYSGSVWPFLFTFQSPKDFKNGGYIVIRQTDTLLNLKKLNFIPSTCDFSDNNSNMFNITDKLGNRPICFPLRNNFNYDGSSTTNQFEGSGFAFKLPTIKGNEDFKVSIFAYAENCGLSYALTGNNIYINFNFGLRIFRSMNMNYFDEARFYGKGSSLINLFAESSIESSTQRCWPAYNGNGQILEDSVSYVSNDIIIHRDMTDFRLGIVKENHVSTCNNCFFNDMKNPANTKWTDGGIYSTKNSLVGSYLALRMEFKLADSPVATYYVRNVIPNFVYGIGGTSPVTGQVRLEVQPDFFEKGDNSKCYMSWGLVGYTVSGKTSNFQTTTQSMLINSSTNSLIPAIGYTDQLTQNFIPGLNIVADTTTSYGFDSGYPKYESDSISIQSKIDPIGNVNFRFLTDGGKTVGLNTQYYTFGLFSTCVKYVAKFPDFSSQFDYFEVNLLYISQISGINSVNRSIKFFKFATDLGIIDASNYVKSTGEGVTFHTTYFSSLSTSNLIFPNLSNNAICLIQINYNDIILSKNTSNTLIIYLNNLMLLDIDYTNLSSTYPITPNIEAYAFNTNPFSVGYYSSVINGSASPITMNYYTYYVTSFIPNVPRTMAYNFIGPMIQLNLGAPQKEPFTKDILLPTFCPIQSGVNTVNLNIPSNPYYSPLVTLTWNTSLNNNIFIDSIDKIFTPKSTDSNLGYFMPSLSAQIRAIPSNFPVNTSVRFNSYSSSDGSKLFIIGNPPTQSNPTPSNLPLNYSCSGFTFLFTKFLKYSSSFNLFLKIDSNRLANSQTSSQNNVGFYLSESPFFVLGKPYYGFLGFTVPTPVQMVQVGYSNYMTGFTRPLLDEYIVNDGKNVYLESLDKLAFYCTSSGTTANDTTYFTNFNNKIRSVSSFFENVGSFVIDWNPDNFTPWGTPTFGPDNLNQQVFKNDFGGNFNIGINLPTGAYLTPLATAIRIQVPGNSILFNRNTVCAMKDSKSPYSVNCDLTNSNYFNSFDCGTAAIQSSSFEICCYNIYMGDSDPIVFPKISLIYSTNNPNYSGLSDNLWSEVSSLPNSAGIVYRTGNLNSKDLFNELDLNNSPLVDSISYRFYQQTNSYDMITFKLKLPRAPLPKSYIKLTETTGNFQNFTIPNINQRCRATFSTSNNYTNDLGDFMIETCTIYFNSIKIVFKPLIRNCKLNLGKYLYISSWPVKSINLLQTQLQFYVDMKLIETNDNLARNLQPYPAIYMGPDILNSPINMYVDNNVFMIIEDIFPKILGETADYYFIINPSYLKKEYIPSYIPNELMIYLSHDYFHLEKSIITDQILCYYGLKKENCDINIPCKIIDINILQIYFPLGIDYDKSYFIRISGIQNPQCDEDIRILYSLNYLNAITGRRSFIVNGCATVKAIGEPASMSSYGPLRLLSSYFNLPTPKSFSTADSPLKIRLGFDSTLNPTMIPMTISSTPVLIISFPFPDFYILYMTNLKLEAQVRMISTDNLGNIVEGSQYFDQMVKVLGNKIQINLSNSISLGPFFLYFDITLIGIPTPIDSINLTTRLKASIINNSESNIYRCYSNNYVLSNEKMEKPLDFFIQNYRGFKFIYKDVKRYIIDIINCANRINEINILAGKATTCLLNLRPTFNIDFERHYNLKLILNDPFKLFKIQNDIISYSTTQISVSFRIGVKNNCPSGRYYVNFNTTDTVNFYPIPPIIIYVDTEQKGSYQISKLPLVPDEGRIKFSLLLSDFTSERTVFKFYGGLINFNDPAIDISEIVIPPYSNYGEGYINVQGNNVQGDQMLIISSSNNYFNLTSKAIGFIVQGKIPDFPSNFNETKAFSEFLNGDTDIIKKNQYQFKFNPPMAPMDLYCVFICFNLKFPTNDEIFNRSFGINEGPLFNYSYYQILNTNTTNILIENLARGRTYKLKCILQTVHSDFSQRNNRTIIFNQIPGTLLEFKTSQKSTIKFAEFYFSDNPGPNAANAFLSYCQKNFMTNSTPYNTNPSCIYCVDNSGNTLPGLNLTASNITTCPGESSSNFRRRLSEETYKDLGERSLQFFNNTFKNPDLENKNNMSTVIRYRFFIIQDLLCDTNTINGKDLNLYINKLIQDANDTKILKQIHMNLSYYFINFTFKTEDKPPVVDFKINNYSFGANGSYLLNITNRNKDPEYTVDCFWAILLSDSFNNTPSFDTIEGCTNYLWCGRNFIDTNYTVITSSKTNLLPFSKGYVYSFWMACYNNIPFAILKGNVTYIVSYNLTFSNENQLTTMNNLPKPIPFLNFSDPNVFKEKNSMKIINFRIEIIILVVLIMII